MIRDFHLLEEEHQDLSAARHRCCATMAECAFHVARRNSIRVLVLLRDMGLDQRSLRERRVAQ